MSLFAFNPAEARKVAAFVEAIHEVEERFNYRLLVGSVTDSHPVMIDGPTATYAVVRASVAAPLTPAMENK